MSYILNEPYYSTDPVNGAGVKLSWTWPPPGFIGTLDPLNATLVIQRSTSTDPAVNGNWPLKPDFVRNGASYPPAPEAGWDTIATISVPPQYMNDDSPLALGFRTYNDPIAPPTVNTYYRIIGIIQTDVESFVECDWAPATYSLDPGGIPISARRFGYVNYYDTSNIAGATYDPSGNVIVAGEFIHAIDIGGQVITAVGFPLFFVKYNSVGAPITYGAITCTDAPKIKQVVTDSSGDIYIAGYFAGRMDFGGGLTVLASGISDGFVCKFSGSTGSRIWAKTFGSTGLDRVNGIAVDADGNVVITGQFTGTVDFGSGNILTSAGGNDIFIAQLDPSSGATNWANRYGGTTDDRGWAVVAASNGDTIVTGYFWSDSVDFGGTTKNRIGGGDLFVARYNSSGVLQWVINHGANDAGVLGYITPLSVAINANDQIVVGGQFSTRGNFGGQTFSTGPASAMFVAKYTGLGVHVWSIGHGGQSVGDNCQSNGVVMDDFGNAYVAGKLRAGLDFGCGLLTWYPITVAAFILKCRSSDGACLWSSRLTSGITGSGSDNFANCIGINPSFNQLVWGGTFQERAYFGPIPGTLTTTPGAAEGFMAIVPV